MGLFAFVAPADCKVYGTHIFMTCAVQTVGRGVVIEFFYASGGTFIYPFNRTNWDFHWSLGDSAYNIIQSPDRTHLWRLSPKPLLLGEIPYFQNIRTLVQAFYSHQFYSNKSLAQKNSKLFRYEHIHFVQALYVCKQRSSTYDSSVCKNMVAVTVGDRSNTK